MSHYVNPCKMRTDADSHEPDPPEKQISEVLNSYLEASRSRFESTIAVLPSVSSIRIPKIEIRFHHLKFDGDNRPRVSALAEILVDHLIQFCLSERRFQRRDSYPLEDTQIANREARRLLRRAKTGGEAGEMLLYFFMEVVLKAPQVVCKMELKGRSDVEVLGSDGIHLRWSETDRVFDVFFGESKLEQTSSAAIRNAAKSIETFHQKRVRDSEVKLVTAQFKYLDDAGKAVASQIAQSSSLGRGLRTNHACLMGFDSKAYGGALESSFQDAEQEFAKAYLEKADDFGSLIAKHFAPLQWTGARFEIFVLPFPSVEEFRSELDLALGGKI